MACYGVKGRREFIKAQMVATGICLDVKASACRGPGLEKAEWEVMEETKIKLIESDLIVL